MSDAVALMETVEWEVNDKRERDWAAVESDETVDKINDAETTGRQDTKEDKGDDVDEAERDGAEDDDKDEAEEDEVENTKEIGVAETAPSVLFDGTSSSSM